MLKDNREHLDFFLSLVNWLVSWKFNSYLCSCLTLYAKETTTWKIRTGSNEWVSIFVSKGSNLANQMVCQSSGQSLCMFAIRQNIYYFLALDKAYTYIRRSLHILFICVNNTSCLLVVVGPFHPKYMAPYMERSISPVSKRSVTCELLLFGNKSTI